MICCLCRKPVRRAVPEMRRTGAGGAKQEWAYCMRCWSEALEQAEYLSARPPHRCSTLVAGGRINISLVSSARMSNTA